MKVKDLKAKLVQAQKRADAAEGRADALAKKLEGAVRKDADDAVNKKVQLITEAAATGAKIDASMTEADIKRAVVKHVDSMDIPAGKSVDYVTAYYEQSLKNAKDRADAGKSLDRARTIVLDPSAPRGDAADEFDEDVAYDAFRERTSNAWAGTNE